ncbi:unnamed protein product, partial [Rotaria sp. Silwood2]
GGFEIEKITGIDSFVLTMPNYLISADDSLRYSSVCVGSETTRVTCVCWFSTS